MKELFNNLSNNKKTSAHWIKLAPSSIGISFLTTTFRFGLAYNHYVTLRLLEDALISINPLFLLISLYEFS